MEQKKQKMYQSHKSAARRMEEAYMRLLARKPYLDITVSDVVKEADVARVSFYRSFRSLADVLDQLLEEFYGNVTHDVPPTFLQDRESAWRELLLHTYRGFRNGNLSFQVLPENTTYLLNAVYQKFDLKLGGETLTTARRYIPAINLHTMFISAKVWLETGMQETPEELTDFVMRVIRQNLGLLQQSLNG